MRIQGENHVCKPSRGVSRGTCPANTLTLDLQPPGCEEIDLLLNLPPWVGLCHRGWSKLTQG